MNTKKDSLIVLSGGMDSTAMLYEFQHHIGLAVSFNYGANHNSRELHFAALNCQKLGIPHIIIDLPLSQYIESSLFGGADAVPEGDYGQQNMKSTVVPFRNGIMLSVACGIAETHHLNKVMIANHSGDHHIYPDCRPEFISAMSQAMTSGTYEGVQIFAPYTNISKSEIAQRGAAHGADFALTYSCYKGGATHCGRCGTCLERKQAFTQAHLPDPTEYQE